MPKSQVIDPTQVRRGGAVEFQPIPVNQYSRTMAQEAANFSPRELLGMQRDMAIIRAFESMLNEVKLRGSFGGIEYTHRGPAHLSIGQEATAVGQALPLTVDDHIYGSHRSHGEILAKGLSAIAKLDDAALMEIMRSYFGGAALRVVDDGSHQSVTDLAIDYLIYGALAEIFGRAAGFNKGMGGSMHAFFPPFGIYPNNAIVGGSGDIAVGAALYKRVNRAKGIVVANIGDASAGCGPVWEGLCFATMDQFRLLWDEAHRGGLPMLFHFVNNFYGMGGQPVGETMGFGVLARLGAGLSASQLHAERIDGFNPLAVVDAFRRKKELLERGQGPALLDTVTYRFSGHSPSDASSYRTKEELEAWQRVDPLRTFAAELVAAKVCRQDEIDAVMAEADARILKAYRKAIGLALSPREDLKPAGCLLERAMFSNQHVESMDPSRRPEMLLTKEQNPRVRQLAKRSRSGLDEAGKPLPKGKCVVLRDAIFEAVLDGFCADPTLVAYG